MPKHPVRRAIVILDPVVVARSRPFLIFVETKRAPPLGRDPLGAFGARHATLDAPPDEARRRPVRHTSATTSIGSGRASTKAGLGGPFG